MFRISDAQFEAFRAPARATWIASAAAHLHATYSDYYATLQVQARDLELLCKEVEAWAARHSVFGRRDVAQLCLLTPTLGHKFWRDPRYRGYITESLGNAELSRSRAVMMMTQNTQEWLGKLWANDNLAGFAERLTDDIRRDAELSAETLRHILPGHWAQFTAAQNGELLAWLIPTLPAVEIQSQHLAYTACALVHGTGWLRDPQYVRLAQAIEQASTPQTLADGLAAIYGELNA